MSALLHLRAQATSAGLLREHLNNGGTEVALVLHACTRTVLDGPLLLADAMKGLNDSTVLTPLFSDAARLLYPCFGLGKPAAMEAWAPGSFVSTQRLISAGKAEMSAESVLYASLSEAGVKLGKADAALALVSRLSDGATQLDDATKDLRDRISRSV